MKGLKKMIRIGGTIQLYIGVCCVIGIVLSVTSGIIMRKFFNNPLNWVEEICTFLFVWLAFCGASVAAQGGKHVSADFLTSRLSTKSNEIIYIIQHILMLLLLGFMIIGGIILQPKMMGHASTTLAIPKNIYYIPILISSCYMFLVYAVELYEAALKIRKE